MTASSRITREELIEQQSRLWRNALAKAEAERQRLASEIYEEFGKDIEKKLNESTKANLQSYLNSLPDNFPETWPIGEGRKFLEQQEYVKLVIEVGIKYAGWAQDKQGALDCQEASDHHAAHCSRGWRVSPLGDRLQELRRRAGPSVHAN